METLCFSVSMCNMFRIGYSEDIHRLVLGRKLMLGGVHIPFDLGEEAHSDGDVVLHALSEAILGALALGDLGYHFPDNSKETLNMDSKIILSKCYQMVKNLGYHINNIDLTIYSEEVRISPIREDIRKSIANILNISVDLVSVKATTWEKMGFIGEGKAIACEAVCLVEK